MKAYLLNAPFFENFVRCGRWAGGVARGGTLDYPKLLSYTTAQLEKENFKVKLTDAVAKKYSMGEVIDEVERFSPDLIVVDVNFASLENDLNVMRLLKEQIFGVVSVIAGPPTAMYSDKILENDFVDIVARFEYDFVVNDLAKALESGMPLSTVDGIWYKENDKIIRNKDRRFSTSEELDQIPFVTKVYRDHLNIHDYRLSQSLYPEVQIFTGRGCIYNCTFCSWPKNLTGKVIRTRSIDNILNEFQFVKRELPFVKEIFLEDDTFTTDKKKVRTFCSELITKDLNLIWSCNTRADLDFETMALMKKAGCRLIIVGYESGSNQILKNIKKGITIKSSEEFSKAAKKAGILIHGDFIIGLPGDNYKSAQETLDFINRISPDILQVAVATPLPGTEFYDYSRKNHYLLEEDLTKSIDKNGYQKCIISYPDFTNKDIERCVDKILKSYYLNPQYLFTFLHGIFNGGGISHARSVCKSAKDFLVYVKRQKKQLTPKANFSRQK